MRKILVCIVILGMTPALAWPRGHWEVEAHVGTWSLNILRGPIEDALGDALQEVVQDQLRSDFPGKGLGTYTQSIRFDSSGHNFGFGIRFYPGGMDGVFSMGVSLERTEMRLRVDGTVHQDFQDGSVLDAEATGEIVMRPWTVHFSMRWDIPVHPQIRPYLTLGFGYSGLTGTVTAQGAGTMRDAALPIPIPLIYRFSETEDLQNIRDLPLRWIPFVELNLGIQLRLEERLALRLDAGIWNGLRIRGGLAVRI